jgi:hypothetical protein
LDVGASLRPKYVELLLGLDAFGGRRHAETAGQAGDGANDCDTVAHRIEPADERAIDLDLIEGNLRKGSGTMCGTGAPILPGLHRQSELCGRLGDEVDQAAW